MSKTILEGGKESVNRSAIYLIEPVKPIKSIPREPIEPAMSMIVTKDDMAFIAALVSGFALWAMLVIVCG